MPTFSPASARRQSPDTPILDYRLRQSLGANSESEMVTQRVRMGESHDALGCFLTGVIANCATPALVNRCLIMLVTRLGIARNWHAYRCSSRA